jgi:pyruvate,water dikinase
MKKYILWFKQISIRDVPVVGGKNASLGEMYSKLSGKGISVPDGFALTADAYWYFLKKNNLLTPLKNLFKELNVKDIKNLQRVGKEARNLIMNAEIPDDLKRKIILAYRKLGEKYGQNPDVAVRSSATAEDLPSASFAGAHETYLNVSGEEELLKAVRKCISSLFLDRAIVYREEKGFDHFKIALSVGIQKMVRSDLACSGVMFTLDTESGFQNVVLINSIYGVGEMIVKGRVIPDEFYVFKPTLKQGYDAIITKNLGTKDRKYVFARGGGLRGVNVPEKNQIRFSLKDEEILTLARWALIIEEHYKKPQDIEWAKDGKSGELFIVQSRPETVHSPEIGRIYQEYEIKANKKPVLSGIAIGNKIGEGRVRIIENVSKLSDFKKGEILVTRITDPDWISIMRMASAIVTEEGGKTAHAAIVSRELGVPCIVGAKGATRVLKDGKIITVDCTTGEGRIFEGEIPYKIKNYDLKNIPKLPVKIAVNIGAPEIAFRSSFLPVQGVGLAREEFIIAEKIRIHPLALYYFRKLKDGKLKEKIQEMTVEHKDKREYFIKELAEGIAQIASAFWPKEVILRLSDLKTNEYRALTGGEGFEPQEENPMLGWRGAARYYDKDFQPAFEMECKAIKRARDIFGLKNISLMIPFCRTPEEGKKVVELLAKNGLKRGVDGLKIIVMCEIPSNVILAEQFLEIFDGMSIGSNDLTQLILGMDRDNARISRIGNEFNEASREMIERVIKICRQKKKYIGICGDAPSTVPGFAEFLIESNIEAISLSPDAVIKTIMNLSKLKHKTNP